MLGQRMAGQVEAEHFLFAGQLFAVVPLGHVGQRWLRGRRLSSSSIVVEQALLAAAAIGMHGGAGLHAPARRTAISCDRRAPSESNAPALISVSIVARLTCAGIDALAEVEQVAERPACLRAATIASRGRAAAALDGRTARTWILPSATVKSASRAVHVRRHDRRCPSAGSLPDARPASPSS